MRIEEVTETSPAGPRTRCRRLSIFSSRDSRLSTYLDDAKKLEDEDID